MADVQLRSDIQAARDRMSHRLGSNREIRKLVEYLREGETVTHLLGGVYGPGTGLVVLTDRRLMFLKDGWTSQVTEDFPFEKISSVQWSAGMLLGKITIFASGNKAVIDQVQKPDGKAMVDAINGIISRGPAHAPAPAAPVRQVPEPAPMSSFEMVKELRNRGVLTPEEFGVIVNRL
ncbi:PH domain-containing protein [Nocardiopsis alba]|uniref:PH domain-containing protein n=1 Tax=Nocardiopsis alba TaxID=53437 RepID=UPI0038223571